MLIIFKSDLIDIKEESRVNSTIEESNEYYAKENRNHQDNLTPTPPPNFISDCFNLTLAYLHYGVGGIFVKYDRVKRQLDQMEQRLKLLNLNIQYLE